MVMFKRNGGRRFNTFSRSRRRDMDVIDSQSKQYAIAESPVIMGGSGYRGASMDEIGKMITQGREDGIYPNEKFTLSIGSGEEPDPTIPRRHAPTSPPTQSGSQQRLPRRPPRRIDSLPSSQPTQDESRTLDSIRDHEDEYEAADTDATSMDNHLAPLQTKGFLDPEDPIDVFNEDDPRSYDIINLPPEKTNGGGHYSLEKRSEQIFSKEHLQAIFKDPTQLIKFSAFLGKHKQESVPMLLYYLDTLKALETIRYSNAVAETLSPLPGFEFTKSAIPKTVNAGLEERARLSFEALTRDALSAYITHVFTQTVSSTVMKRITGTLPSHLRDTSDGLAEVFCLSDPSRRDNPLVLASEEFHRSTQYGVDYAMGRNCRFLQGPRTNRDSTKRIREAIALGTHHSETFLNYRRDGSPFLNLLMVAPLCDNRGKLRYFLGAQVDVSGLAKECADLEALQHMLATTKDSKDEPSTKKDTRSPSERARDSLKELSEMFSATELATIRNSGGRMNREVVDSNQFQSRSNSAAGQNRPRLLLKEPSSGDDQTKVSQLQNRVHGKLKGVYQHYLLVRPYPSLRILFASPSLRFPGILQSPFMNRIGSSDRVKDELLAALEDGRGVTAKVKWLSVAPSAPQSHSSNLTVQQGSSNAGQNGRNRWIHCTPLLSSTGEVGVWMIVLIDDVDSAARRVGTGKFKQAPPVASPAVMAGGHMSSERQRQLRDQARHHQLKGSHSIGSFGYEDENDDEEMDNFSIAGGSSLDGADFRVI